MVALSGDEAAVGLGLCAWLVGIAAGAALARPLLSKPRAEFVTPAIALLAVGGLLEMFVARLGRKLADVAVGELIPLGPSLKLALLVFVFPGAMVSVAFVAIARSAAARTQGNAVAIGRLYVFEAIGSLLAGVLVSLVLVPRMGPCVGLLTLLTLGLVAALPAARARLIEGRYWLTSLAALTLLCAVTPLGTRIENATQRSRFAALAQGATVLDWVDTPYEHQAMGAGEVRNLYASGVYVRGIPDSADDESRAHQVMLLNAQPSRVLALGGIESGLLRFCLKHPVRQLDLVVHDRRAFEFLVRHLESEDRAALADARVAIHFQDPRRYLVNDPGHYDLILLLEPDPATLYLARATTVQFARLIASHLTAAGTYVTRFTAGPNVQTGQTGLLGASLYRTLREVFPVVRAAPGPVGLLVAGASVDSATLDPSELGARWRRRGIESNVFAAELLPDLYPAERVARLDSELEQSAKNVTPSDDNRPLSFLYALSLRQQMAQSNWARVLKWAVDRSWPLRLVALLPSSLLLLISTVLRLLRRPRGARHLAIVHATAATGAAGMALSLMLFFSFQTRVGALYSELGLLSALFMLGLAAGGVYAARLSLVRAQAGSLAICAVLALTLGLLDRLLVSSVWAGITHGILLVLAGAATGAVFPCAAKALLDSGGSVRGAASATQFADHAGAAVAAVVASVIFIPILGLVGAAVVLCALQSLALISLMIAPPASIRGIDR